MLYLTQKQYHFCTRWTIDFSIIIQNVVSVIYLEVCKLVQNLGPQQVILISHYAQSNFLYYFTLHCSLPKFFNQKLHWNLGNRFDVLKYSTLTLKNYYTDSFASTCICTCHIMDCKYLLCHWWLQASTLY